jgi:hypothetical protein
MDYFTKQLDEEINSKMNNIRKSMVAQGGPRGSTQALNLVRAKIEYGLVFQLAVLWHANVDSFRHTSQRVDFLENLNRMPLGKLWRLLKDLNILNKKNHGFEYKIAGGKYLEPRNEILGHGWTFTETEAYDQLVGDGSFGGFLQICQELYESSDILKDQYLIIQPEQKYPTEIIGANFTNDGMIKDWQYSTGTSSTSLFTLYDVYGYNLDKHKYVHLSPFICLDDHQVRRQRLCRVFQGVHDSVLGKAKYNTLFESELWTKIYDDFKHAQNIKGVGYGANGIKYNEYETSYSKYIAHDYHKRYIKNIEDFLDKKSTVTLTLQGQGGLGKTALIQYVLGKIISGESKILSQNFDCIVFCTAKTIRYDVASQTIEEYSYKGYTASYKDILQLINRMIEAYHSNDVKGMEHAVINSDTKFILVIDDFESFSEIERINIAQFVSRLDVNKHKIIITTRIANFYAIGEEKQMTHLSISDTIDFLQQYLEDKNAPITIDKQIHDSIHKMTTGNSLFVIQLAELMLQLGVEKAIEQKPGQRDKDIKFLYGKIYDSLTPLDQQIFEVMGGMVNHHNLSNLIEKLRFVVEAEMNDAFDVSLQKLVRMHIIKIPNDKVFEVYNEQIWNVMRGFWDDLDHAQKQKYEDTINKIENERTDLDLNNALLQNLKLREQSEALAEVIVEYRNLFLSRPDCPIEVKLLAIINLLDYLYSNQQVVMLEQMCKEYEKDYRTYYVFVKKYAEIFWNMGLGYYNRNIVQGRDSTRGSLERRNAEYISDSFTIIISFLEKNTNHSNYEELELLGILVERQCIEYFRQDQLSLQERRDPNTELSFNSNQRKFYYQIREHGQELFNICEKVGIQTILAYPELMNAISQGLYRYAFLSYKRYQYEEVSRIASFLLQIIHSATKNIDLSNFTQNVKDLNVENDKMIADVKAKINSNFYASRTLEDIHNTRPDHDYFPFKLMNDNQRIDYLRNMSLATPAFFAFVLAIMNLSHVGDIVIDSFTSEFYDLRDEDTERILNSTKLYYKDRGVHFPNSFGKRVTDSFSFIRNCISIIENNQSVGQLQAYFDQLNVTEKRYVIMRMLHSSKPLYISFVAGLGNDAQIYGLFIDDSLGVPIDNKIYTDVMNKYADKYKVLTSGCVAYAKIRKMIDNQDYINQFPEYFNRLISNRLRGQVLQQVTFENMLNTRFGQHMIAFIIGIAGNGTKVQEMLKKNVQPTFLRTYEVLIKNIEREYESKYNHLVGRWWSLNSKILKQPKSLPNRPIKSVISQNVRHDDMTFTEFVNYMDTSNQVTFGMMKFKELPVDDRIRALQIAWTKNTQWRTLVAGLVSRSSREEVFKLDDQLRKERSLIKQVEKYMQDNGVLVDDEQLLNAIRNQRSR